MQICWSLLCCTILQAAYYVDILVVILLLNTVESVLCRYLGHYFPAQYCAHYRYLGVTLLHNTVQSVLCRYLGHYFAAQYCRQRTMLIPWSLLCCTILQAAYYVDILVAAYYVDILVVTLLHNTVGSVLCRYVGCYFSAQYCRQRTLQMSWSLLCYTILQAVYYVDILFITLLHNMCSVQYCRQCTIQISWSLLCCTILQAAYYVDINCSLLCCTILQAAYYVDTLVITLLHNIVGSVLCRYLGHYFAAVGTLCSILVIKLHNMQCIYLGHYFAAQYCRQRTIRYLGHYFAAQYCRQSTLQISQSLLCCTILWAAYYVDILVIILMQYIVGSVLCINLGSSVLRRYLGRYFAAQYCRQVTIQICWSLLFCTLLQAAYYVDVLVVTLLHNIVGSVLCKYLGYYFAAQYSRQRTMQISWSLLCCTILQAVYYVDILVITLLHNTVGGALCRYLGHYFAVQYYMQRTMQISWSLLCCTIMQAAYYVDILVITLLHNIVGSVLCRYLGHYFAAQYCSSVLCKYLGHYFSSIYCRQRTMQISWSLLCCTIMSAAYYVDILFFTLLHNIVGSVLCRYLGHYFAAQYCRQRTMQISWSLLFCTILQAANYIDILAITLLHNTVGFVLCRYFGHYFAAQYCRQRTLQLSCS